MENALPVEQWSSGIFRRFQCVQHRLASARSKVKPEKESVQVDDTKFAELDDQIRKARYRKGPEAKMAKYEEAQEKSCCRTSSSWSGKHEDTVERAQHWLRKRKKECQKSSRWKSRLTKEEFGPSHELSGLEGMARAPRCAEFTNFGFSH